MSSLYQFYYVYKLLLHSIIICNEVRKQKNFVNGSDLRGAIFAGC